MSQLLVDRLEQGVLVKDTINLLVQQVAVVLVELMQVMAVQAVQAVLLVHRVQVVQRSGWRPRGA